MDIKILLTIFTILFITSCKSFKEPIQLDFWKPYTLTIEGEQSNGTFFHFIINQTWILLHESRITLTIEKMRCQRSVEKNYSLLLIEANEGLSLSSSVCKNIDETLNSFQNVERSNFYADLTKLKIYPDGDWKNTFVQITLTVYIQKQNCADCHSLGTFCCTKTCKNRRKSISELLFHRLPVLEDDNDEDSSRSTKDLGEVRCIPNETKCNSHANCGFSCNSDESEATCNPQPTTTIPPCTDYSCTGYSGSLTFIWILIISIAFFVMTPTVIVVLICYFRAGRILFGTERERHEQHEQQNQNNHIESSISIASNSLSVSPANDVPPKYEVVHEIQNPPPCFCSAIRMSISSGPEDLLPPQMFARGIENPGFNLNDENPQNFYYLGPEDQRRVSEAEIHCGCNNSTSTSGSKGNRDLRDQSTSKLNKFANKAKGLKRKDQNYT